MGDAVRIRLENVTTENTAIVWGDQAGLRPESVRACLAAHQSSVEAVGTFSYSLERTALYSLRPRRSRPN